MYPSDIIFNFWSCSNFFEFSNRNFIVNKFDYTFVLSILQCVVIRWSHSRGVSEFQCPLCLFFLTFLIFILLLCFYFHDSIRETCHNPLVQIARTCHNFCCTFCYIQCVLACRWIWNVGTASSTKIKNNVVLLVL